jgi:hypothetical protein
VGEAIVGTFGAGGTVPNAMVESSLAIQMYGETTTAALDKALKYTDFQKRMTEALKQFDLEAKFGSKEKLKVASMNLEALIKEGDALVKSETQQEAFARNGIKLYADKAGVIQKSTTATNTLSTATDGLGTATTNLTTTNNGLNTSLGTTSANYATMYKAIGPATTGIAGLDAKMNPFNTTLTITAANAKAAGAGLQAMAQAAQKSANLALQASQAAMKASQNMAKAAQIGGRPVNNSPYRVSNTGGAGKGPSGSHYTTFRGGVPIASGSGMAPPIRKAAVGMHETIDKPTWILAGEAGKERVDIGKPGSGGGFSGTINVFVDGVQRPARYSIGTRK